MKTNKLKNIKIAVIALAVVFSACKKTLDINPKDSIESSSALQTREGVEASVISIYSSLKDVNLYGNRLVGLGEALSDNGRSTNKSGRYVVEAVNGKGSHYSHWTIAYNAILRINLTLEALQTISDPTLTQPIKDSYTGELEFLRALYYFDLVKAYAYVPGAIVSSQDKGGVPIILKSVGLYTDALNLMPTRPAVSDVYTQIYSDLSDAVTKLPALGSSPARASLESAQALYSRVALYNKDWANSISYASSVITTRGSKLSTPSNYFSNFGLGVNPESLFEVTFFSPGETLGVNVSLQTLFTTLKIRGDRSQGAGFGDLVPTSDLLNALGITVTGNGSTSATITARSADVRNLMFEVGSALRGSPYVECTKFLGKNGTINLDNVPVFRIAEMYLNRAEAYANSGQDALALADVNTIRVNRGLTVVALTGVALKNEILLQRRLEFAFEGQRFLDLKRNRLDIFKPVSGIVVSFTDPLILPGLPQGDVDASRGSLVQNFGY